MAQLVVDENLQEKVVTAKKRRQNSITKVCCWRKDKVKIVNNEKQNA